MKLDRVEFIDEKLMEIRDIISLEDAFHVCDTIITNTDDEMLNDHVINMLDSMGYDNEVKNKIEQIIKDIQN